jgi:hypothetical protein
MKNAFVRAGQTCVSMLIAGGLIAGGLFAGEANLVTVTLPHAVTVGNTVLPIGQYTISSLDIASGESYFVVRSEHTAPITVQAQKVTTETGSQNTEVTFSRDGNAWHFDKMFILGEDAEYLFVSGK